MDERCHKRQRSWGEHARGYWNRYDGNGATHSEQLNNKVHGAVETYNTAAALHVENNSGSVGAVSGENQAG
jgi:hypothetical protein